MSDADLETAPEDSRASADRRVLRRAALAGTIAFVATAVVVLGLNAAFGGDGQGALVWFMAAIVVGLLVWSGWLVLVLLLDVCLLYTSPSPRDGLLSRMPSSA